MTLLGIFGAAALVIAAAFMAQVPSAAWLVLAIFLLRQTGQGLASHVGTTAMARYFDADRGKAVALAALGFAAGESAVTVFACEAPRQVRTRGGPAVIASTVADVASSLGTSPSRQA